MDLASTSSVGISTVAAAIAYPDSSDKLIGLLSTLEEKSIPYTVVGRASNLLFKSRVYNGIIVKTTKIKSKSVAENTITLSCGIMLADILHLALSLELGGIEGLYGIPGTVGGMVKSNAGAFGYEVSDRFVCAECYLPSEHRVCRTSREDMRFSYRSSALSYSGAILLCASFDLVPKSRSDISIEIAEYRERRKNTQPTGYPSLGSIFKRYNGISAGYYVDKAGLKGYRIGGAEISQKHAGFIINKGGATADDYIRLIEYVKERVYTVFGIELEEEIQII